MCNISFKGYLDSCWDTVHSRAFKPKTIISLCGAHLSEQFSEALRDQQVRPECKVTYQLLFAKMQQARNLTELSRLFNTMCDLALAKDEPQLPDLNDATAATVAVSEDTAPKEDEPEQADSTYRTDTPFGKHFDKVVREAKMRNAPDSQARCSNIYLCPGLPDYIAYFIMPLAPLWSQLVSDVPTTNAVAESHFTS